MGKVFQTTPLDLAAALAGMFVERAAGAVSIFPNFEVAGAGLCLGNGSLISSASLQTARGQTEPELKEAPAQDGLRECLLFAQGSQRTSINTALIPNLGRQPQHDVAALPLPLFRGIPGRGRLLVKLSRLEFSSATPLSKYYWEETASQNSIPNSH